MAIFLCALLVIAVAIAVPNIVTQGQREKEEELIWRGEQYARAVKLYYRKNGRFPQSIEDLTKTKTGIRYMRQAYKDPMNREDGSWRLIYVAPNGQLIGSLTRTNALFQLPGPQPGGAGPASGPAMGQPGGRPPSSGTPSTGTGPSGGTGASGGGPILGGNIIGVGSKIAKSSIRVYNGAQTYREWEFIWDPTKDAVLIVPGQPIPPGPPPPAGRPRQP